MKRRITTIALILVFCVGLSLLLYPTVSDWWNSYHQSRAVALYAQAVSQVNEEEYQRLLARAQAYNEQIAAAGGGGAYLTPEQQAEYESQLDITGTGIMGYIEIPAIDCTLPIYHGTDDSVLQIAVGHITGTSLPIGGESTHCVLSGHRGLPSARLFTDIDQLAEGDIFLIRTLNEVLTYEVDQIRIVLPHETQDLQVIAGQDLCTLVTCTPYGINTHRLLVRGHRVETKPGAAVIAADAIQIRPAVIMPIIAAPILMILLIWLFVSTGRKTPRSIMDRHRRERNETKE